MFHVKHFGRGQRSGDSGQDAGQVAANYWRAPKTRKTREVKRQKMGCFRASNRRKALQSLLLHFWRWSELLRSLSYPIAVRGGDGTGARKGNRGNHAAGQDWRTPGLSKSHCAGLILHSVHNYILCPPVCQEAESGQAGESSPKRRLVANLHQLDAGLFADLSGLLAFGRAGG